MVMWLNVCLALYAVVMLIGGVMGFKMGHSLPSLITGLVSTVLLLAAVGMSKNNPRVGYGLASLVVIALIGVFLKRSFETNWQARNVGLVAGSVLMLILLIVGHFAGRKSI